MKLLTLLEEVTKAAEAEDSTANAHVTLAQKVIDLADMVGWAEGPIDPEGRYAGRFDTLLQTLRARHAGRGEPTIAALHDALAGLHDTIRRHDHDLAVERDADEDDEG